MPSPSLLDWLRAKLAEPRTQRRVRFGTGGLAVVLGLLAWPGSAFIGLLWLLVALACLGLGLLVQGSDEPRVAWPTREGVTNFSEPGQTVPVASAPPARFDLASNFATFRLPLAVGLALAGQWLFTYQRENAGWGALGYLLAAGLFVWSIWRDQLLAPRVELAPAEELFGLRLAPLGVALLAGGYTYWAAGDHQFRLDVVLAWGIAVAAWLAAAWDVSLRPRAFWERLNNVWHAETFTFKFSRSHLLLIGVLAIGAYFLYSQLPAIPPEITSDHSEKLLDVNDLVQGQRPIFFPRNTGREPLQFYATLLVINLFGTGLTHLSLKIFTAFAGLCTLPFIYLIGRELEDDTLGLLAALLAGVSFWLTAISRVGLRFPLSPVFAAPTLYFLLRGLRRGTRNDFLLAGLCVGTGLYGYSPFRIVPVLVVALVAWCALWPVARGRRWTLLAHAIFLFVTVFFVFLPLLRYANDVPEMFWYRTLSRLTDSETQIVGSKAAVFLANQLDTLRAFNWQGDRVWVNTIPDIPFLDFITGALLILGTLYALARLLFRRDWVAGALLLALPILFLPSSLNLAFPDENPSIVRMGGAIPVVFILVAYPLWLLHKRLRVTLAAPASGFVPALAVVLLAGGSAFINHDLYFNQYPKQYMESAENASEIGQVIHDFARSIGSYETAFVVPYPYWVDTRAVGMYAGNFGWDAALWPNNLDILQGDPRPKMFILHPDDLTERPDSFPAGLRTLRELYPTGTVSVYHSAYPDHDFLIYFVPGTASTIDLEKLLGEPTTP